MAAAPGISAADVETALRVLRAAAPPRTSPTEPAAAVVLRQQLLPAVNAVVRRERQHQRFAHKASVATGSKDEEESPSVGAAAAAPAAAMVQHFPADVVQLGATHLSRVLYPNPVCFLSTWTVGGLPSAANLMTISWLAPLDNDGHFLLSMNQRRFSAVNLQSNPFLCLSVAVAGLEQSLLRVGGCTGAGVRDKALALGIPLCRPGWLPCEPSTDHASGMVAAPAPPPDRPAPPPVESEGEGAQEPGERCAAADVVEPPTHHEEPAQVGTSPAALNTDGVGGAADSVGVGSAQEGSSSWPADGDPELCLPPMSADALTMACASAVAVTSCVAHVAARVRSVRAIHGHYVILCETLSAHVRREYWSGKTLEPQREGLPPLLSFVGSQRFCHTSVPTSNSGGPGQHQQE